MRLPFVLSAALLFALPTAAAASPISILAAENFYGDIATGDRRRPTYGQEHPQQPRPGPAPLRGEPLGCPRARRRADRHHQRRRLRSVGGEDARCQRRPDRTVITSPICPQAGRATIPTSGTTRQPCRQSPKPSPRRSAKSIPTIAADYAERGWQPSNASLKAVADRAAEIKGKYAGAPVTATEPVFGYMAEALGLAMRNERFQLSVMNDTEPSARDTAAFERRPQAAQGQGALLQQPGDRSAGTDRLLQLAQRADVPVVGVSETKPAGQSYAEWMLDQLDATEKALAGPSS